MRKPRLRDTVTTRELDGEVVVLEPVSSRLLHLNGMAGLILLHCDGEHTEAEIVESLRVAVQGADPELLARDVAATLDTLEREKVVL